MKQEKAKSKAKVSHESTPTLFAMGYFDLIFKIKFSKKDLLKSDEDFVFTKCEFSSVFSKLFGPLILKKYS